jgi:Ni,Fe-hydrogenase I cytochrome b subunit
MNQDEKIGMWFIIAFVFVIVILAISSANADKLYYTTKLGGILLAG